MTTTLIDGDSIAYAAAYGETLEQMAWTCDKYLRQIIEHTKADSYEGFIEAPHGKRNFRKWVAVSRPYKGNRRGRQKPQWLMQAKQYLNEHWHFKYVISMESEDACTIRAFELGRDGVIIACIDKDLYTAPGAFYNYNTHEFCTVSEDEADYNLHMQMLKGDPTDNILGIEGMGDKRAAAVLDGVPHGERSAAVARAYFDKGYSYGYMIEIARLVRILRTRNDVFTPVTLEQWNELTKEA